MDNALKFDTRLVDKLLGRKQLTQKEYETHLAALPDVSGNATNVEASATDREIARVAPAPAAAPTKGKKG
jgi:hypothetical protein